MQKIAVVSDLSGLGRCSLTAAIPIISAAGLECCPVTTAVLTNQTGYDSYYCSDLTDTIDKYAEEWGKLHFVPDVILTGYMASADQIDSVISLVENFKSKGSKIIVDPVMADAGVIYKDYNDEMCAKMKVLCSEAEVITPNLTELCILSGREFAEISSGTKDEVIEKTVELAKTLLTDHLKLVVVTGIFVDNFVYTVSVSREKVFVVKNRKYEGSFSGTGDMFSALFSSLYIKGFSPKYCVKKTVKFIQHSVDKTTDHDYCTCDGTDFQLDLKSLTTRKIVFKTTDKKAKKNKLLYITTTALMAALTTVMTAFVSIKTGINDGYLHFGDAMIYIAGSLLPAPYAFLSAAIGGAFADILAGAVMWAPFTAIIKGLNSLPFTISIYLARKKRKDKIITPLTIAMSVVSGFITVFGYLLAESLLYSPATAWTSVPFSIIQAVGSLVIYLLLGLALDSVKFKKRFFKTKYKGRQIK